MFIKERENLIKIIFCTNLIAEISAFLMHIYFENRFMVAFVVLNWVYNSYMRFAESYLYFIIVKIFSSNKRCVV